MSQPYDDWIYIRTKCQSIHGQTQQNTKVTWGNFGLDHGTIQTIGTLSNQKKQIITAIAKDIRTKLYGYPATCPVVNIRVTWPDSPPVPAEPPPPPPEQDPLAPPVLNPPLPPTTPPSDNDETFIVST